MEFEQVENDEDDDGDVAVDLDAQVVVTCGGGRTMMKRRE